MNMITCIRDMTEPIQPPQIVYGGMNVPPPPRPDPFAVPPVSKKKSPKLILIGAIVIVLLAVSGFFLSKFLGKSSVGSGEVVWWGLWEDESSIAPLIAQYQAKNPKVKVKYLKQSQQDYRERLANALAKGTGPDIFTFHNSWTPMLKNDLSSIPASVMAAAEFAQAFYPVATSDLTLGSGVLGIPLEYDAITLYVNEDIFAAAGLVPPVTWDDLRSTAIKLTQKDDQGNILQSGIALGRTENVDHWQEILGLMMVQNGVDLTKPTSQLAKDALTFYTIFSSADGIWDATLPASTVMFAGGKLAMYFAPSWRAFEISQMNPSLKFKTVPVPQLPRSLPNQKDITYASYWVQGVWQKSKNKTPAWDFLKFMSSSDSLAKLYSNASKQRSFGEPYPRVDMSALLSNHPILGSIISMAPNAQSWYLQSRTFDGPTGINSLINKYFEDAVNAVVSGVEADKALETAAQGVSQVLRQYGITR